jgi:hypothetical protein
MTGPSATLIDGRPQDVCRDCTTFGTARTTHSLVTSSVKKYLANNMIGYCSWRSWDDGRKVRSQPARLACAACGLRRAFCVLTPSPHPIAPASHAPDLAASAQAVTAKDQDELDGCLPSLPESYLLLQLARTVRKSLYFEFASDPNSDVTALWITAAMLTKWQAQHPGGEEALRRDVQLKLAGLHYVRVQDEDRQRRAQSSRSLLSRAPSSQIKPVKEQSKHKKETVERQVQESRARTKTLSTRPPSAPRELDGRLPAVPHADGDARPRLRDRVSLSLSDCQWGRQAY